MISKNIIKNILVVLLLAGALGAVLVLTRRKQELRRGAYFAGSDVLLAPDEVEKAVGEEFLVELMAETRRVNGGEPAKVDFVQAKMCFGPEITVMGNLGEKITLSENFTDLMKITLEDGCLVLAVKAEKVAGQLGSGLVKVATIKFKAVKLGSGKISIDNSATRISGYNPDRGSRDMALELGKIGEVNYRIGGGEAERRCGFWDVFCVLRRLFGKN